MRPRAIALLVAGLLGAAGSAAAADISSAEQLVFLDNHLASVRPPAVLRYTLEETGKESPKLEPAAAGEQLKLDLKPAPGGGCCAVSAEEVGGQAFGFLPSLEEAKSNPVILYFLERDIRRMQTATGGQSAYFRRRIRLALADQATVRDTKVRYAGQEIAAREVRVAPYADDPRRAQLEGLADKSYSFVLAAVPGGVYQLRTATPDPKAGAGPAAETVLTLADASVAAADSLPVQERSR